MAEKKNAKKNEALREKLLYAPKNGYDTISEKELAEMEEYCKGYKLFLDNGKTERMCVEYCIELATARGFKP